jgi:hypothetical protein
LAHGHAGWLTGAERGQVIGIMAFDLSAAFDTVGARQLLPKLQLLGVSGRALVWFESYLTGGSQQVSWDGILSNLIAVRTGVRQGSIFGPVLFLVLISDMATALRIGDDENVVYANNMMIWQAGRTVAEVVEKLTDKAARFAEWSRGSGLTMNASKTQLLLSADPDMTNLASEVANLATDSTNLAREVANLATDATNPEREAADRAKGVTTQATRPSWLTGKWSRLKTPSSSSVSASTESCQQSPTLKPCSWQ